MTLLGLFSVICLSPFSVSFIIFFFSSTPSMSSFESLVYLWSLPSPQFLLELRRSYPCTYFTTIGVPMVLYRSPSP